MLRGPPAGRGAMGSEVRPWAPRFGSEAQSGARPPSAVIKKLGLNLKWLQSHDTAERPGGPKFYCPAVAMATSGELTVNQLSSKSDTGKA